MKKRMDLLEIEKYTTTVTTQTLDLLYSYEGGADAAALYFFYVKTAKWQQNSSVKANEIYCRKKLRWGWHRFKEARKVLKSLNLIEDIIRKNKHGQVEHYYVKVKFIWGKNQSPQNRGLEQKNQSPHYPVLDDSTYIPDVTDNILDVTREATPLEKTHSKNKNNIVIVTKGAPPTPDPTPTPAPTPESVKPKRPQSRQKKGHALNIPGASLLTSKGKRFNKDKNPWIQKYTEEQGKIINELQKYFREKIDIPHEDGYSEEQSFKYWKLLWLDAGRQVTEVKKLIDLAANDVIFSSNITSSYDLYTKRIKLVKRSKVDFNNLFSTIKAPKNEKEEKLGYTEDELLTEYYQQEAEENGTTVEEEREKHLRQRAEIQEAIKAGKI